ncbi:unnamed protein product [Heligmosomoides polygyrus]|uniref:TerD domain-containing protein n=1 Tax=Heligmosomoides polygyrus TaxID=6339 RepID=A0A183FDA0_HELPZ|nr:unnamed protein product [Heligmosomoides polygyrus]
MVINAHGDCAAGSVQVDAVSPSGRAQPCMVSKRANSYMASFTPQQVGLWKIGILYDGEHIRGSPFSCQVFDAGLVQVYGLDVGLVGQELKFNVNASEAGRGHVEALENYVTLENGAKVGGMRLAGISKGGTKRHCQYQLMYCRSIAICFHITSVSLYNRGEIE